MAQVRKSHSSEHLAVAYGIHLRLEQWTARRRLVMSIGWCDVKRSGIIGRAARVVCRLVVLVVMILPLGFARTALAAETGAISGKVTDASTHSPIEGIEVCARTPGGARGSGGRCATTDALGEYSVSELLAGSYTVRFFVPLGTDLDYAW